MENDLAVGKCWQDTETGQMWRVVDGYRAILLDRTAEITAMVPLSNISDPVTRGLVPILAYQWDRELLAVMRLKRVIE
jgi:hypothetical protein